MCLTEIGYTDDRYMTTSLCISTKEKPRELDVREKKEINWFFSLFLSFFPPFFLLHINGTITVTHTEIQVLRGKRTSFSTVIILHFNHIRALPQGMGRGNTDRACVFLLAMARENMKLAHQSWLVFFMYQYKVVNQICHIFNRDPWVLMQLGEKIAGYKR